MCHHLKSVITNKNRYANIFKIVLLMLILLLTFKSNISIKIFDICNISIFRGFPLRKIILSSAEYKINSDIILNVVY